jgi:hypothetical protein
MPTFNELRREQAQEESRYISAAEIMATTIRHVLRDKDSKLHPVTERLLEDAVKKFETVNNGD